MHHFHQLCRGLQQAQDGAAKEHYRQIQENRGPADEQKRQLHTALHAADFFPSEIVGKQRPAAHAHTDENRSQKRHQSIGASHRGQGIRP